MSATAVAQVASLQGVLPLPRWQSRDLLGLNRVRFELQHRCKREVESIVHCARSISKVMHSELGFYCRVLECVDALGRTKVALRIGIRSKDDRSLSERQLIATLGDRLFELCRLYYDQEARAYYADVVVLLDWAA